MKNTGDCKDSCVDVCEGSDSSECKADCEMNQRWLLAFKMGFIGAVLCLCFLWIAAILSAVRLIGNGGDLGAKSAGITCSFLAWVSSLIAWSYFFHHPLQDFDKQFGDECKQGNLSDDNCYFTVGPGFVLLGLAWVLSFSVFVCHVVCPTVQNEKKVEKNPNLELLPLSLLGP